MNDYKPKPVIEAQIDFIWNYKEKNIRIVDQNGMDKYHKLQFLNRYH